MPKSGILLDEPVVVPFELYKGEASATCAEGEVKFMPADASPLPLMKMIP
jgi:hypothetical protein